MSTEIVELLLLPDPSSQLEVSIMSQEYVEHVLSAGTVEEQEFELLVIQSLSSFVVIVL
jgi:hypothetical protein